MENFDEDVKKLMKLGRRSPAIIALLSLVILAGAGSGLLGICGPFTDVSDAAFCPFVLEIFTLGITTGTSPTTYDPTSSVTRLQMAAFLSRTVDGVLRRGSRHAIAERFWTAKAATALGLTTVGVNPVLCRSDGADVWVTNYTSETVSRVRASDGKLLETWTGVDNASAVVIAMNRVLVTGGNFGLFSIDPTQAPGAATQVVSGLPANPNGIAFDGAKVWVPCLGAPGSVTIITPGPTIPWAKTTVTTGFTGLWGALYDGANVWVTDQTAGKLFKLDPAGAILQTVTVGTQPQWPAFDGSNIWVPNIGSNSVTVVRASNGAILQTLTGNGLDSPQAATFDGERVLVTNLGNGSGSLWKAADLTTLPSVPLGGSSSPWGACSDGQHFWVALFNANQVARF